LILFVSVRGHGVCEDIFYMRAYPFNRGDTL
jgi:hypothetical protein